MYGFDEHEVKNSSAGIIKTLNFGTKGIKVPIYAELLAWTRFSAYSNWIKQYGVET